MLNHLQTIKQSAHWWSQESQSSFLMHSTLQPLMHSTLSSGPRWDPLGPPEHDNLASQDTNLPHRQLLLLQHLPLVILGA